MKVLNIVLAPLWFVLGFVAFSLGRGLPGMQGPHGYMWMYVWVFVGWVMALAVTAKINPRVLRWVTGWPLLWLALWLLPWIGYKVFYRLGMGHEVGMFLLLISEPWVTLVMLLVVSVLNHRATRTPTPPTTEREHTTV